MFQIPTQKRRLELLRQNSPAHFQTHIHLRLREIPLRLEELRMKYPHALEIEKPRMKAEAESLKEELALISSFSDQSDGNQATAA